MTLTIILHFLKIFLCAHNTFTNIYKRIFYKFFYFHIFNPIIKLNNKKGTLYKVPFLLFVF